MPSISRLRTTVLACFALLASCSSDDTSASTKTIVKLAGDGQSVTVGAAVPVMPSVKVTDGGVGVAGVTVTFAVVSGGGTVNGASATTNGSGVAAVAAWILGLTAGGNTLTASVAGGYDGSPVTFTATALAPGAMTKQAGDGQTATVHTAVAVAPSIKLVDGAGNPVVGAAVTFFVASGGGSLNAGGNTFNTTTNASGIAAVTSWQLGTTPGANTLTAFTGGVGITGNPATFSATGTP